MEYKRSSHVEEEEEEEEEEEDEEEEEEEEEENRGHHYTTAAAAPVGAPQQQVHGQALGLGSPSSQSSMMESAAFSRPLLPPNSSLVSQLPLPPPGFMPPHRQPQLHPRRAERERERVGGAQHQLRRHNEPARNGVLGGGTTAPPASTLSLATGGGAVGAEAAQWRYRECLRNHAARLGAHVLDGCCEFMPSAGDGAAALACAACGCHRSFHRREAVPGVVAATVPPSVTTPAGADANSSRVMPLLLAPPHMQTRPHVPVFPLSAPAALTESSSEELRGPAPAQPPLPPTHPPHAQVAVGSASAPPAPSKKRFRTKFTAEQKERMREFAHRVGWRIHKADADAVDAFCAQVGVSRRVLKVWMHNNKHLAMIAPPSPSSQPPPPPPHHHPPPPPPAAAA